MHTPRHDLSRLAAILTERPLRVLFSACLLGETCTWDGKGFNPEVLQRIANHPRVQAVRFCPEHFSFGTPRAFSSLHDGHGDDVLDGKASMRAVDGTDWTPGMLRAADAMVAQAREHNVDVAIMLDISPSCGSHVVYKGDPAAKVYQQGRGVAAAALQRAGVPIIAHRDHLSVQRLLQLLEPDFTVDPAAFDFLDHPWYREYFKGTDGP